MGKSHKKPWFLEVFGGSDSPILRFSKAQRPGVLGKDDSGGLAARVQETAKPAFRWPPGTLGITGIACSGFLRISWLF